MAVNNGMNIFKASAGSGKTFRLVGEYLKLLFDRPMVYRNILAVTFTNKATAEMKERILRELARLAKGEASKYPELLEAYGSEFELRRKAIYLLKLILHDYSRFSVMTIDSFFQKVIRSFAREISLNASFRTEIDSRRALEDAVDLMFQEIDSNELLMNWMVMFLEENLEDGRSWDFRKELLKFGKEVEKESFKVHGDELLETLSGKEELSSYINSMKGVIRDAEARLNKIGQEGLDLISHAGLTYDQFKNSKNSFANIFNKLLNGKFDSPTKTMADACNNLESWYKNTDSPALKAQMSGLYHNGLNQLLVDAVAALAQEIPQMNSANAILKNIYPFGLLGNIALRMKEILSENNMVLLADSGRMIGKIIDGNDTPFIYEKVGLIYRHFMLDEFQDTSRQQWMNFRPLVENALASGNSSLVVGDVKQSIYRWRNGDWNLLANQLASDMSNQLVSSETLGTNWRSRKNIIDFNNSLFWRASRFLNDMLEEQLKDHSFPGFSGVIADAYSDQYQYSAPGAASDGYVRVSFVPSEGSSRKSDFREKALGLLVEQLESVQQAGIRAEEITILVRENSDAERVARALWERKRTNAQPGCCYDVITSDTLKIGQSPVVRFIVNFFKIYTRKETNPLRGEILYGYYRLLFPDIGQAECGGQYELHDLFGTDAPLPELFRDWLDAEPNSGFLTGLLALPLYELAVAVADHFKLGLVTGEKLYLQAFLDMVLEYGRADSGGLPGFLDWWEGSGSNKTLNLPSVRNFIRISSIHQSKGLEYHTVFVPFCNWEVAVNASKPNYLWSVPAGEPFDALNLVLLKFDKSLKDSIFAPDYYRELMLSMMDNLNLLYVALTRSVNNLFIILPYTDTIKTVGSVAELVQTQIEHSFLADSIDREKYLDLSSHWDPETGVFELGELVADVTKQVEEVVPEQTDALILNSGNNRMEIRLHSKDYFRLSGNLQAERINRGNVMHQVFEKIITRKDIGPVLYQMVSSGILTQSEADELKEKIGLLLQEAPYADWFDEKWKVLNERDILRSGESRHRPDRVMLKGDKAVVIDYKTGEKSDKDVRQMKGYLDDLRKMGYSSCKGNIWYLHKNEIVRVEQA